MAVIWEGQPEFDTGASATLHDVSPFGNTPRYVSPYHNGAVAPELQSADPNHPTFVRQEYGTVRLGVGEGSENAFAVTADPNDGAAGGGTWVIGTPTSPSYDFSTARELRFTGRCRWWDEYIEKGWGTSYTGDLLCLWGKRGAAGDNPSGDSDYGDLVVGTYDFGSDVYLFVQCRKWGASAFAGLENIAVEYAEVVLCTTAQWSSAFHGTWFDLEVKFRAATVTNWTTNTADNDGVVEVWVDGVKKVEITTKPLALCKGTVAGDVHHVDAIGFGYGTNGSMVAMYVDPVLYDSWTTALTYDRNLVTGFGHTVVGSDNVVSGRTNTVTGDKNKVHGENVTVVGDLNAVFNLDASARTITGDGLFIINGTTFSPPATIQYSATDTTATRLTEAVAVVASVQPADSIGVRLTDAAFVVISTP
jgi:hypothetical protein